MQVEVEEICMRTRFGGRGFFGFGDIATFKFWPNFPSDHGLLRREPSPYKSY